MINPNEIRWVVNSRTKPLEDELNLLAVKRKCDYPNGETIVKLTQIRNEHPNADIRFSNGVCEGLCYLHFNENGQWNKDANGNWVWIKAPSQQLPHEGYKHSVTNTYGMNDEGLMSLTETMIYVKKVLIHRILGKV
jgi:hypothetical protein